MINTLSPRLYHSVKGGLNYRHVGFRQNAWDKYIKEVLER